MEYPYILLEVLMNIYLLMIELKEYQKKAVKQLKENILDMLSMHEDRQKIVAVVKELGDVELRRVVRDLAVTHVPAVEPDVKAGVHPFKVQ